MAKAGGLRKQPSMHSFEDTEEDVYDRVVRPAPTAVPTAQSSLPPPSAIKKSTSINDVNRAASGSATATTTTAAAAPPGSLGERRMSKEPHRSVSMMNTSATKLPPLAPAGSPPPKLAFTKTPSTANMRSVEAPTPTSAAAPGAQATAAPSGWTKRVTAMVGLSKKPSVERGRVVISAPSNFTHVKSITTDDPPPQSSRMSRSESIPSIHEELAAEVAHETLGSQVDSQPFPALLSPQQQPSNGASFVEYNDTQSLHPSELRARSTSMTSHHAENRMSRSIKLITGDLVTGAYFLRHIKGSEAKQVFISSSEDLMHFHVWPNYYDKADKKAPREVLNVRDLVDVKTGVSGGVLDQQQKSSVGDHEPLSFCLSLTNGRIVDLEAFTPEERDLWVSTFGSLVDFLKAK